MYSGTVPAQDGLGFFLDECCLVGPTHRTKAGTLYAAYTRWCAEHGTTAATQQQWGSAVAARGFQRFTNNGTWYRGVGLRESLSAPTEPSALLITPEVATALETLRQTLREDKRLYPTLVAFLWRLQRAKQGPLTDVLAAWVERE